MTTYATSMAVIESEFAQWTPPWDSVADERWLQAYAAAVDDTANDVFDLGHPGGIIAHPIFSACVEWPIVLAAYPAIDMPTDARRRGLHVAHAIEHHSAIRVGDRLATRARLITAEMRSVGGLIEVEFETHADGGQLRSTSRLRMLYPGVELVGAHPRAGEAPVASPAALDREVGRFPTTARNAPIYTECARIWNPIHTDTRVATQFGLPAPVLHGTEILARAVTMVKNQLLDVPSAAVRRLECRFGTMVLPGDTLVVRTGLVEGSADDWRVAFEVVVAGGKTAVSGRMAGIRRALT